MFDLEKEEWINAFKVFMLLLIWYGVIFGILSVITYLTVGFDVIVYSSFNFDGCPIFFYNIRIAYVIGMSIIIFIVTQKEPRN